MTIIENISTGISGRTERFINVEDAQCRADLLKLLRRGLNTWEPHPNWIDTLRDELTAMEAKDGKPQV